MVRGAADRSARFETVNLELARGAGAGVSLVRAGAKGKRGGSLGLLALAARRHRPALEIRVAAEPEGAPVFAETWHWNPPPDAPDARVAGFAPPVLPPPLDERECAERGLPEPERYRAALKAFASAKAGQMRRAFTLAARVIVGTQVLATAAALWAFKGHAAGWAPGLLAGELALLRAGLGGHEWLPRSRAAQRWAPARLAAEVARSVSPLAGAPRPLGRLFDLPLPDSLRPLLRPLNALHLRGLRGGDAADWPARRDRYASPRRQQPKQGQIDYYAAKLADARRKLKLARATFYAGSGGAVLATAGKLAMVLHWMAVGGAGHDPTVPTLGFLAVLLPVVAVAALSLAASFDLEAQTHSYGEMLSFLQAQTALLVDASSEDEFAALALETESRLLGETANWHARRAFTGVA